MSGAEIAERLVARISQGHYAPGQRLIEVDLAREFNVGRNRVRETLRLLAGEGYLSVEENKGVVVRRLSRQEAIDLARLREVVEGLAARQAAEQGVSGQAKKTLEALQGQMDQAAAQGDIGSFNRFNEKFHRFIVDHAGNLHLAKMLRRLSVPLYRLQFRGEFTSAGLATRNEDHQRITAALLDGQPDAAEAAMRAHIHHGISHLTTLDDDNFAPS